MGGLKVNSNHFNCLSLYLQTANTYTYIAYTVYNFKSLIKTILAIQDQPFHLTTESHSLLPKVFLLP